LTSPFEQNETEYPKRDRCHFHRFTRLLHKTCAAQEIGTVAAYLLTIIAGCEDAARYKRGVTYYDSQLQPIVGVASYGALHRARKAAIAAGWLFYRPGGKGRAGVYWTIIPDHAAGLDDTPTDEGLMISASEMEEQAERKADLHLQNGGATREQPERKQRENGGKRRTSVKSNGGLSNLTLIPIPDPEKDPPPPKGGEGDERDTIESEFVKTWNACTGVVCIRGANLTTKRRKALRTRLADSGWDWRVALQKFPLRLTVSNPGGWKPDVDWFLKPDSVQKILEGKYDWEKKQNGNQPTTGPGLLFDPTAKQRVPTVNDFR
jgi:hypothetical protein